MTDSTSIDEAWLQEFLRRAEALDRRRVATISAEAKHLFAAIADRVARQKWLERNSETLRECGKVIAQTGLGADYLAEFSAVMERVCSTPDRFSRHHATGHSQTRLQTLSVSSPISRKGDTDRYFGRRSPTPPRALLGWQGRSMTAPHEQTIANNVAEILKA